MKTIKALLFSAFMLCCVHLSAQDVIFKKTGEKLHVKITGKTWQSRAYKLAEDPETMTRYISTSLIDSIAYGDGSKEVMKDPVIQPELTMIDPVSDPTHFMAGFDISRMLFFGNPTFSFEFLPGKGIIGLKTSLGIGLREKNLIIYDSSENMEYENYNRFATWHSLSGVHAYIFPGKAFRAGTGFSWLAGHVNMERYRWNETSQMYDMEVNGTSLKGVIWDIQCFYKILDNLGINLGMDVPLYIDPNITSSTLRCEVLLCF